MKRLQAMILALALLTALLPIRAEAPLGLDRLMEVIEQLPPEEAMDTPVPEEAVPKDAAWKQVELRALYERFNSEHYYFAGTIVSDHSLMSILASGIALAMHREIGFDVHSDTEYYLDIGTPSDDIIERFGADEGGYACVNCAMITVVDRRKGDVYWVFWDQNERYAHWFLTGIPQNRYEWNYTSTIYYRSRYDSGAYWPGHEHITASMLGSALPNLLAVEDGFGITPTPLPPTPTPWLLRCFQLPELASFTRQKAEEQGFSLTGNTGISSMADLMMTACARFTAAGVGLRAWGRSIESSSYRVLLGRPASGVLSWFAGCSDLATLRRNGTLMLFYLNPDAGINCLYFWNVSGEDCFEARLTLTEQQVVDLGITFFFTAFYMEDKSFLRYSDMVDEVAWMRAESIRLDGPTATPVGRPTPSNPVGRPTPTGTGVNVRPRTDIQMMDLQFEISPDRQSIFIDRPVVSGSDHFTLAYNVYDSESRPVNYLYSMEERVAITPHYGGLFNVFVVAEDLDTGKTDVQNIGWHTLDWPHAGSLTVGKAVSALSPDRKSFFIDRPQISCRSGQVTIAYNLYDSQGKAVNYFYSTEPRVAVTPGYAGRFNVFIVVTDPVTGESDTQNIGWANLL